MGAIETASLTPATKLRYVEMGHRARHAMRRLGLSEESTLLDLARFSQREVDGLPNSGPVTSGRIREILLAAGLDFGHAETPEPPAPPFGLRDYFAAHALAGVYANPTLAGHSQDWIAGDCYRAADAMLAARRTP